MVARPAARGVDRRLTGTVAASICGTGSTYPRAASAGRSRWLVSFGTFDLQPSASALTVARVKQPSFAAWLPHAVLFALVVGSAAWLLTLLAPVAKALVVGASLALLTHGVLCGRFSRWLNGWYPWPRYRAQAAATLALGVLVAALAGATLAILWAALGGLSLTVDALWGVAIHDQVRVQQVVDQLTARAVKIINLYPALPLTREDVHAWLTDVVQQTSVGPAFLRTMVTGGGGLVIELVLTAVFTWWLYVHGPAVGERLLALLPGDQRGPLARRLHERAGALVLGTFGRAFLVGTSIGIAAWLIGGFPPVLVAAVAMVVSVMPMLGPMFVWLPLASLLLSQGHWVQASALAVACQGAALTLGWILDRMVSKHSASAPLQGTGPVLLLTLVGGLWGFGARGLILAPAALIMALTAWDALLSLYAEPAEVEPEVPGGHA